MERLADDAIDQAAAELGWERRGEALARVVVRDDFADAMRFVNDVAALAEGANHHPDISISWNRVELVLSTHSAGGVTQADVDLARAVNGLLA
ncbi:MAG: 4a-hydroxytetrahydrobiopterin dehydratase [Actinomycetota bacterium]|nr:4a-hydroxytetrahydrobiopterin dehydratase [Actinomycetota bacterium]